MKNRMLSLVVVLGVGFFSGSPPALGDGHEAFMSVPVRFEDSPAVLRNPRDTFRLPTVVKEKGDEPLVFEAEQVAEIQLTGGQRLVENPAASGGLMLRQVRSVQLEFETLDDGGYAMWLLSAPGVGGPLHENINGASFAHNRYQRQEAVDKRVWIRASTRELKPGRNTWRLWGNLLLWGAAIDKIVLTKDEAFHPADGLGPAPTRPVSIQRGSITSSVIDVRDVRQWKKISCRTFAAGGDVQWHVKLEGSDLWMATDPADLSAVPPSRPFRIRLTLEPSEAGASPIVDTVRLEYEGQPPSGELTDGVRYTFDRTGSCTVSSDVYQWTFHPDGSVASVKLGRRELLASDSALRSRDGLRSRGNGAVSLGRPLVTADGAVVLYGENAGALFRFMQEKVVAVFANAAGARQYRLTLDPELDIDRIMERDTGRVTGTGEVAGNKPQIFFQDGASVYFEPPYSSLPARVYTARKSGGPTEVSLRMNGANEIRETIVFSATPDPADVMQMDISCSKADHHYSAGETVSVTVETFLPYGLSYTGTAKLIMTRMYSTAEEQETHEQIQKIVVPAGNDRTPVGWEVDLNRPGLYAGDHQIVEDGKAVRSLRFFVLYAPELLKAEPPPDFDDFWERTMAKLAEGPVVFERTSSSAPKGGYRYSRITFKSIDGRPAWANLYEPTAEGAFPAILKLPPVGTPAPRMNADEEDGFVVIGCEVWGHDPRWPPEKVHEFRNQGGVKYEPRGVSVVSRPEEFWLYYAYCTIARAYDILEQHPKVDKNRIYITGASQGGGLAIAAAGLRPQNAGVLPVVPGLCRIRWQNVGGGAWGPVLPSPEKDPAYEELGVTYEEMQRMAEYFETAHMMKRLRSRMVMWIGLQDNHTPPHAAASVFFHTPPDLKERKLLIGPWTHHGGSSKLAAFIPRWAGEDQNPERQPHAAD